MSLLNSYILLFFTLKMLWVRVSPAVVIGGNTIQTGVVNVKRERERTRYLSFLRCGWLHAVFGRVVWHTVGVLQQGGGVPEHYDRLVVGRRLTREYGVYSLIEVRWDTLVRRVPPR